jgi:hypothetical protein
MLLSNQKYVFVRHFFPNFTLSQNHIIRVSFPSVDFSYLPFCFVGRPGRPQPCRGKAEAAGHPPIRFSGCVEELMGPLSCGLRQWRGLRLHELGDRIHGVARRRRLRRRLEEEGMGAMPSQIHYLQAWCRRRQAREERRRQRRITADLERGRGDEFGVRVYKICKICFYPIKNMLSFDISFPILLSHKIT